MVQLPVVPVSLIHRTRLDIYGEDDDSWGPLSWTTVGDINDGNYIALDLASGEGVERNYILCDHEVSPNRGGALSSLARLRNSLIGSFTGPSSWVGRGGYMTYGDALPLTVETASLRIENDEVPRKG